jgi:hypothetical protein
VPTVAISSPRSTDNHPFHSVAAPTEAATVRPKKTSAKTSGGPNWRTAQAAMSGVATIMRIAEARPPSAEHETAAPTALPARPFCVMG